MERRQFIVRLGEAGPSGREGFFAQSAQRAQRAPIIDRVMAVSAQKPGLAHLDAPLVQVDEGVE